MSSFPTAEPGPGGFHNPVGEVLPRHCPPGALGKRAEPQRRRGAKMEARRRCPHRLGFLLTGPAPGPWGPRLLPGTPNDPAWLQVRPGVFPTSRGATVRLLLLRGLSATQFKAIGGKFNDAQVQGGPGQVGA